MKKKTFDAVAWMRTRRTKIDNEDQWLSWEEKRRKTRQLLDADPLWLKLKNRIVEPPVTPSAAAGESRKRVQRQIIIDKGNRKRKFGGMLKWSRLDAPGAFHYVIC